MIYYQIAVPAKAKFNWVRGSDKKNIDFNTANKIALMVKMMIGGNFQGRHFRVCWRW